MSAPDRTAVEQQLNRILASPRFVSAERLSAFLRFVVQSTLDGNPGRTKEVVIATEVYRRGPDYDPQVDSAVRADASRLRARLADYYATVGISDPVLIEIPKGSYAPTVSFRPAAPEPQPIPSPDGPSAARRQGFWRSRWGIASVVAVSLAASVLLINRWAPMWWAPSRTRSAADLESQARQLIPTAGDHLLRAAHPEPEYSLEVLLKAAHLFEQATTPDPASSGAWAGLARVYELAGQYDSRYLAKSREAARRSVDLDPANAEGHYMLSYQRHFEDWDFTGAQRGFARVIELRPNSEVAYRHFGDAASLTRQFDAADAKLTAGLRVFPNSPLLLVSLAMLRFHEERYDEMLAVARQLPDSLDLAHWVRGLALEQKGQLPQARSEMERCLQMSPKLIRCSIALIHLDAHAGRAAEADARAASLADNDGEMTAARVFQYAGARHHAKTLEWIERAIAQHEHSTPWVLIDPRFKHLRTDPQFRQLALRITASP